VPGSAYYLVHSRTTEPAQRRGTALQRTRTLYLVGAADARVLIAGAVLNLLGD
jgi:hypothetical protein